MCLSAASSRSARWRLPWLRKYWSSVQVGIAGAQPWRETAKAPQALAEVAAASPAARRRSQPRRKPAMKASPAPSTLKTSTGKPGPTTPSSRSSRDRAREGRRSPCGPRLSTMQRAGVSARIGCSAASVSSRRRRCGSPPRCRRSGRRSGRTCCRCSVTAVRVDEALLAERRGRRGPRGPAGSRCRRPPCRPRPWRSASPSAARRRRWAGEKCVPVTTTAPGRGDVGLVDVGLVERHVGAVLAVEDQREGLLVADAEDDQRGQPLRVGDDAARRRRPRAPAARG